jgi:hypothetical protein
MQERVLYPVCPHRNVSEAFECFLGPDSCHLDRFLDDQRSHRASRTFVLMRAQGRRAYAGAARGLHAVALVIPKAVTDLNLILTLGWMTAWISGSLAFSALTWASNILLHHAGVWLPRGWRHGRAAAAALARRATQLLRRPERRYAADPQRQLILF